MMTKEEIIQKLNENPDWEPQADAPPHVWDLFYDVIDEREDAEFGDDEDMDDDDDSWDDEEY